MCCILTTDVLALYKRVCRYGQAQKTSKKLEAKLLRGTFLDWWGAGSPGFDRSCSLCLKNTFAGVRVSKVSRHKGRWRLTTLTISLLGTRRAV